jgi:hypothetical protein
VWTSSGILWYLPLMLHADRIAQDLYRLPPPRPVEGTGGRIYTMVLATPGVLDYPEYGYSKLTPAEVLQDPAWLESMTGIPIVDDDQRAHAEGVDTATIQREAIGRILRAWWDPTLNAALAEGVIDVERGLRAIDSGITGVSPAYTPDLVPEVGSHEGQGYTRRERSRSAGNNVAITARPRGVNARLQADAQGEPMTTPFLTDLKALTEKHAPHADAEGGAKDSTAWAFDQLMQATMDARMRADAAESALAEMKKAKAKPEGDADPEEEAAAEEDMAEAADAVRLADSLGVPVKGTLVELRRTIAQKLEIPGADKMAADSLGAALTVYRLASARVAKPTAADKLLRDYEPPGPHADAKPASPRPLSMEEA